MHAGWANGSRRKLIGRRDGVGIDFVQLSKLGDDVVLKEQQQGSLETPFNISDMVFRGPSEKVSHIRGISHVPSTVLKSCIPLIHVPICSIF